MCYICARMWYQNDARRKGTDPKTSAKEAADKYPKTKNVCNAMRRVREQQQLLRG